MNIFSFEVKTKLRGLLELRHWRNIKALFPLVPQNTHTRLLNQERNWRASGEAELKDLREDLGRVVPKLVQVSMDVKPQSNRFRLVVEMSLFVIRDAFMWRRGMNVGTKSVLFGVHNPLWHGPTVWWSYRKLYGREAFSLPVIAACFLHDLGYWGKPNMDGTEGETHPYYGAEVMRRLFDKLGGANPYSRDRWYYFTLLHSRTLAKRLGRQYSKLALADKLAFAITWRWFYVLVARLTGEINGYMEMFPEKGLSMWGWLTKNQAKQAKWVEEHKNDGAAA